jgi:hypothetical protein
MTITQQIRRALYRLIRFTQFGAWEEARREITLIRKLLGRHPALQPTIPEE